MPRHEEQKKKYFFIKKSLTMLFDFARVDYAGKKLLLGTRVVVEKENFFSDRMPKGGTQMYSKKRRFDHGAIGAAKNKIFWRFEVKRNMSKYLGLNSNTFFELGKKFKMLKKFRNPVRKSLTFPYHSCKILFKPLKMGYSEV